MSGDACRVAAAKVSKVVATRGGPAAAATWVEVAARAAQGSEASAGGASADPVGGQEGPVEEIGARRRVGAGETQ